MVTASNIDAFREHAMAVLNGINTNLQTDEDFANAERTVRWAKEVEDKLGAAKEHALSQTTSISQLFQTIDAVRDDARAVRLTLDKLVKAEKENRKAEIVSEARKAFADHWSDLCRRVGGEWIPAVGVSYFADAIKNLKNLDSMRDKASTALAHAKIEASAVADRIDANRKQVEDMSLMPDFAQVCTKAPDDFTALYAMRKQQRADAEADRLEVERAKIRREEEAKARAEAERTAQAERERIRAEEQAKAHEAAEAERARLRADAARREAELKALADVKPEPVPHQAAQPADTGAKITLGQINQRLSPIALSSAGFARLDRDRILAEEQAKVPPPQFAQPQADTGAKITLGQINQRLSPIALSAAGLAQLGIQPAGKERAAVLYLESDLPRICAALTEHLQRVVRGEIKGVA